MEFDAAENYVSSDLKIGVNGWIVICNCMLDCIPYRCKIEQPATQQLNGIKNS